MEGDEIYVSVIPFDSPVDDFDLVIVNPTSGGYGTNRTNSSSVLIRNRRGACGRYEIR